MHALRTVGRAACSAARHLLTKRRVAQAYRQDTSMRYKHSHACLCGLNSMGTYWYMVHIRYARVPDQGPMQRAHGLDLRFVHRLLVCKKRHPTWNRSCVCHAGKVSSQRWLQWPPCAWCATPRPWSLSCMALQLGLQMKVLHEATGNAPFEGYPIILCRALTGSPLQEGRGFASDG